MKDWSYKKKSVKSIEDFPQNEDMIGFVYRITNVLTGKFYIGKKSLRHSRKTRISKTEKLATATRKTFKVVIKESDWKTYCGSSKDLTADIKKQGGEHFKREIVELCYSKKSLSYCEMKHQVLNDVLTTNSYNGNILGKFYPKDLNLIK